MARRTEARLTGYELELVCHYVERAMAEVRSILPGIHQRRPLSMASVELPARYAALVAKLVRAIDGRLEVELEAATPAKPNRRIVMRWQEA